MSKAKPAGSPGYTFPLMLIILVAVAFGASRLDRSGGYRLRRDKEEELLFRGKAYMRGIKEFFARTQRYPRDLKELGGEGRKGPQYIRQLYKDPMTGGEFDFIRTPDGKITGVVSRSRDAPFRTDGFEKELAGFEDAKTYADWKFNALPPVASLNKGAGAQAAGFPGAQTAGAALPPPLPPQSTGSNSGFVQ